MKAFTIGLLSLALLAVGTNATATPNRRAVTTDGTAAAATPVPDVDTTLTSDTSLIDFCFWSGNPPDCTSATCPAGYEDCGRDQCGGSGPCCAQGQKINCCLISAGVC